MLLSVKMSPGALTHTCEREKVCCVDCRGTTCVCIVRVCVCLFVCVYMCVRLCLHLCEGVYVKCLCVFVKECVSLCACGGCVREVPQPTPFQHLSRKTIRHTRHDHDTSIQTVQSLVATIVLQGCEMWTLLRETGRRIQALNQVLRRLLSISHRELKPVNHITTPAGH